MKVVVGYTEYKEKEVEVPEEILENENKLCNFCFKALGEDGDIDLHCVKNPEETRYYFEW